ncbi:MAG: thiolase domain-containing protein [Candidatus Thermoplasmatota archaeon]|jgi:acetyl-CoA C-acetyltransferase|nr:thiolase domain-containing protein [Candidatus Thermoplasmatota archaeon]MCL5962951.1 thiolase domain-containing protein [Candidatus Thermoplasmatota archaeon]
MSVDIGMKKDVVKDHKKIYQSVRKDVVNNGREVAVVAAGMTQFGKARTDSTQEELVMDATRMALFENDLNYDPYDIKKMIDGTVISYFSDHFEKQLLFGAIIRDYLGLNPLQSVRAEGGGATGGLGVKTGYEMVKSGDADFVLVAGFEKMSEVSTTKGNEFIALASDTDFDFQVGGFYTAYYAAMATRYIHEFGITEKQLAKVAVKNRNNAQYNYFAQTNSKNPYSTKSTSGFINIDDVYKSNMIATPLKRLDCCLMSDGAAVVLLAEKNLARKLTKDPVIISGIGGGTDTMRPGDRPTTKGGLIKENLLLPHEKPEWYENMSYPGLHSFRAGRAATKMAYRMAGIKNPLHDIDVVELHDAFTSSELQTYEDLGLAKYGDGGKFIDTAEFDEEKGVFKEINPKMGDHTYVNPSGGLIGCMHAVGATGIMQVGNIFWQLQKKMEKFNDNDKLQVKNAKKGLAHSHAGTGSDVTVIVMSKDGE